MRILVTGGAGYIGSHAVRELVRQNFEVVVLDDLSSGHALSLDRKAHFVRGGISDVELVARILKEQEIESIMHFAGTGGVGEAPGHADKCHQNNYLNLLGLLEAVPSSKVRSLIFSSTASVYGVPENNPIQESSLRDPISAYGRSKLLAETAVEDFSKTHGLGCIVMRYFNAAGADPDGTIGEDHQPENHLIPRLLVSARDGLYEAEILGTDYSTPDGTCVRDYVHVSDIASAHVLALAAVRKGECRAFNVGSERGFSVREVIAACERVTGCHFKIREGARRVGDPPILIASSRKIRDELDWRPRYSTIEDIVAHAWKWHSSRPNGYRDQK